MVNRLQFYIDGAWVDPVVKKTTPVVNPATEDAMYDIALGSKADVDKAVAAAKRAFETSRKTINEVMYEVGYSDLKAFREVFRRITGMSPLAYRSRYNKDFVAG